MHLSLTTLLVSMFTSSDPFSPSLHSIEILLPFLFWNTVLSKCFFSALPNHPLVRSLWVCVRNVRIRPRPKPRLSLQYRERASTFYSAATCAPPHLWLIPCPTSSSHPFIPPLFVRSSVHYVVHRSAQQSIHSTVGPTLHAFNHNHPSSSMGP